MHFVPLHVYSGYSYHKSAIKFSDYFKRAKELNYTTLSITDLNNFTGSTQFAKLAKVNKFKYIIGEDLYIDDMLFTFIVKDEVGYSNLLKISYQAQTKGNVLEYVHNNNDGLIIIISTNNIIFNNIDDNFSKKLAKLARGIESFYLGLDINSKTYNDLIREFSYSHGYSLVAFPFIKYIKSEDDITLKMLYALDEKEVLEEKKSNGEFYLRSLEELKNIYTDEEILKTEEIANMIDFEMFANRGKMLHYENDLNLSSDDYLRKIAFDSLKEKGLDDDNYKQRLNMELDVITSMGYSDYFLIVKDYVGFAKTNDIVVGPGRGSAVGSLVSFALNITENDPLKYNLIFERFLNKERQSLPDIDVDFEDGLRKEVINYIHTRYGNNRVAEIIAVQKFGAKQALGDVGRIFNYERRDIELFTKLISNDDDSKTLREMYKTNKEFRNLVNEDKYYLEIVTLASKLEGLPRQSTLHPAGIVINNDDLIGKLPVDVGFDGTLVEQVEKDYLEDQMFLKMDLLSLTNLTVVKDCIERIKANYGISLDIYSLPYDDKKAIELIASKKTMGLFQIESFGMRNAIEVLKPTEFEDIVALLALFRPGPLHSIQQYADVKYGKKKITYTSDVLKEILSPTYGNIVYQEQIMQIANKMAGFSLSEADLLRRAISKKDSNKLSSYQKRFIEGCLKNNYSELEAKDIYERIKLFGDYGLNRSHALGYATLTCRMAYLKAYYPKEFYASILSHSNSGNYISTISEIKANNIKVYPPDINISTNQFVITNDALIFPLSSVKSMTSMIISSIIKERMKGPFNDFFDFVVRLNKYKLTSKQLLSLIDAGAFDSIDNSRTTLRSNIPAALNYASMIGDEEGETVIDMSVYPKPILVRSDDNKLDNLNRELDVLGLMLSGSPLQVIKDKIKNIRLTAIRDISLSTHTIKVACMIRTIKSIKTKAGKPMAFATVYDDDSELEITIFNRVFENCVSKLKKNTIIILEGYYKNSAQEFVLNNIYSPEDVNNG